MPKSDILSNTAVATVLSQVNSDGAEKWQQILADLITDPKELLQLLELDPSEKQASITALSQFPLRAPRPFVARIRKGDWSDPLLLQIWPALAEQYDSPGFSLDPLDEMQNNPVPGLLHKYSGRVLLTVAPHCAIHCRYCFRRHFDYAANTPGRKQWQQALDYIRQDKTIEEVIYSGGDPLAASDNLLTWLTKEIADIPHVSTLRIHTRLPVMIPQRINQSLLDWLGNNRLQTVLVLHCNHAQEIDNQVLQSLNTLATNGVILLNQAVLLKGINDNSSILAELSKKLFSANVLPYYLHMLDPVKGVAHFDVEEVRAKQLMLELQRQLPGYLVPKLVREIPGQSNKIRIE